MYETITLATNSDLDAHENIDTNLSDESQADICRKEPLKIQPQILVMRER